MPNWEQIEKTGRRSSCGEDVVRSLFILDVFGHMVVINPSMNTGMEFASSAIRMLKIMLGSSVFTQKPFRCWKR